MEMAVVVVVKEGREGETERKSLKEEGNSRKDIRTSSDSEQLYSGVGLTKMGAGGSKKKCGGGL